MWKWPQPQPPCWGRSFGEEGRQLGTGYFRDFGRTSFGLIITSSAPLSFVMMGIPVVFHQGTTHLAVLSFIAGAVGEWPTLFCDDPNAGPELLALKSVT